MNHSLAQTNPLLSHPLLTSPHLHSSTVSNQPHISIASGTERVHLHSYPLHAWLSPTSLSFPVFTSMHLKLKLFHFLDA